MRHFEAGESICIDGVTVHTIPTPHDAVDTVSFIVEFDGRRLGIFTDLGHPFRILPELLESVDAAYLESNYDVGLLEKGPYPEHLKMRIAGGGGHLSSAESADVLRRSVHCRMKWIALSHLSEENNTPETRSVPRCAYCNAGEPSRDPPEGRAGRHGWGTHRMPMNEEPGRRDFTSIFKSFFESALSS